MQHVSSHPLKFLQNSSPDSHRNISKADKIEDVSQDIDLEYILCGVTMCSTPEVIALPITGGSDKYLKWIEDSTQKVQVGQE